MKNIHLIKNLAFNDAGEMSKDIELSELFNGPFRRIVELQICGGAVLSKHKAAEPNYRIVPVGQRYI